MAELTDADCRLAVEVIAEWAYIYPPTPDSTRGGITFNSLWSQWTSRFDRTVQLRVPREAVYFRDGR